MRIHAVIATTGRPDIVRRVVLRLGEQSRPPDGVLVVGASPDDIAGLGGAFHNLETLVSRRGLCRQRNTALDHLGDCTDVVAFFDDDFVPADDYLQKLEEAFILRPNLVGATGKLLADGIKSPGISFEAGAAMVIVGHSERRADNHETSSEVKAKAEAAVAGGLIAIMCVGETEAERDAGRAVALVNEQLRDSVPGNGTGATLVVAYEPVWAIGTGRTPTIADIGEMHAAIRKCMVETLGVEGIKVRILYGGSVKPSNAAELLHVPEVDGALVGGASLKATDFVPIIVAAQ